jgi:hypothetical protein
MFKHLMVGLVIAASVALSGCLPEKTIDTTTHDSLINSIAKVRTSMPESEHEEFDRAISYFQAGGVGALANAFAEAFGQTSDIKPVSISHIDGMTGAQVVAEYNKEIKAAEHRANLKALSIRAKDLREAGDYEGAIAAYSELQTKDPESKAAKNGLVETESAIKLAEEKTAYIPSVEISAFEATRIDTYSKKDVPAVRFKLRNNGSRTLNKVEVVVYFRDKLDKVIYEESYHPVLVSEYSYGDAKPLKPGYVHEMGKTEYYTLDSNLGDWEEGNAVAKVVNVEFGG